MNLKIIVGVCVCIFIYVAVFSFISANPSKHASSQNIKAQIFIPICKEDTDIPISLLDNGTTACLSENTLYVNDESRKIVLKKYETKEIPTYIQGAMNYLLLYTNNVVTIHRILDNSALEEVTTIPLATNETPISVYGVGDINKNQVLYLSTYLEARKSTDTKSKLYRIEITSLDKTIQVFTLRSMLIISSVFSTEKSEIYFMKEMFSFLEQRHIVYFSRNGKLEELPCKIDIFSKSTSLPKFQSDFCENYIKPNWFTISKTDAIVQLEAAPDNEDLVLSNNSGEIHFLPSTQQLSWVKNDSTTPQILQSYIDSWQSQILAQYSTRIGKRVYNCFDFSESIKITLKVCTPEL